MLSQAHSLHRYPLKSGRFKHALLANDPIAYIQRHGTTKANTKDAFRGWEDFELEEQGLREAHEAAEWYLEHGIKPKRIVCSPLARAKKTAEIIGLALGVKVETDDRLKPFDVGEFTGKKKDSTWDDFVHYLDHPDETIPKGESVHHFAEREIKALEELLADAALNGPIIIVAHTSNIVIADCFLRTGEVGMDCRPEEKDIVAPGGTVAVSKTMNIWPVFKNVKEEEEEKEPEKAEHEEYDSEPARRKESAESYELGEKLNQAIDREKLEKKIQEVLQHLTPRESEALRLRFGLEEGEDAERTLTNVGERMGLSRERIRQLESKGLRKLRHPALRRELEPFLSAHREPIR